MNLNHFFDNVCFGDNGYILTQLDIEKFINDNSANIDQFYNAAISFESSVLIQKFREHAGLSMEGMINFPTDELNRFISLECGQWDLFMFILKKRLLPFRKYEPLRLGLINGRHISQTDRDTFFYIMEYKRLPDNSNKIRWISSKANAMYFQDFNGFTLPEFNKCYTSDNGKPFHENMRQEAQRDSKFMKILKLHPIYGK